MPSRFQRLVLAGLAFKAMVIGGGHATGREPAEYFLPHTINERLSSRWEVARGHALPMRWRLSFALALLAVSMLVVNRVGLVRLIADAYGAIVYLLIAIYVLPLLVIGFPKIMRTRAEPLEAL